MCLVDRKLEEQVASVFVECVESGSSPHCVRSWRGLGGGCQPRQPS